MKCSIGKKIHQIYPPTKYDLEPNVQIVVEQFLVPIFSGFVTKVCWQGAQFLAVVGLSIVTADRSDSNYSITTENNRKFRYNSLV